MSTKYEQVKKYYDLGVWNDDRVRNAVGKEWITAEEYHEITGKTYGAE